ncbi:MAG: Rieske 2Fe-2S domain-containing protein [Polyangiaceae bacterium]|nr:Rieske 2Fe-2S domain-containing protein [Polyangiaceae bacterium]
MFVNKLQMLADNLRTHNNVSLIPNPYFPEGWFAVCLSKELKKDQLKRLSYFSTEFIAIRDENGEAVVMDAYCPHMGAFLGRKGKVVGGQVVCPFHEWKFNAQGDCVEVPFCERAPSTARSKLKAYPTIERNGMVMMWRHSSREPYYEIPDLSELSGKAWTNQICFKFITRGNSMEAKENVCDGSHFVTIHDQPEPTFCEFNTDGPFATHRVQMGLNLKRLGLSPKVAKFVLKHVGNSDMTTSFYGPGFQNMHALNPLFEMAEEIHSTPVDEHRSIVWFLTRVSKESAWSPMPWLFLAIVKAREAKDVMMEVPIFAHKKFMDKPLFQKQEMAIPKFRKWYGQFYAEGESGKPVMRDIAANAPTSKTGRISKLESANGNAAKVQFAATDS